MCTAVSYKTKNHYFGRNLDNGESYGEEIVIMPRSFPLSFKHLPQVKNHEAIIGIATIINNTPLFYDGVNESGLACAGLNFPGNAYYRKKIDGKYNVTSYEFITWILTSAKTTREAKKLLENTIITDDVFAPGLPPSTLHWMISDKSSSIVVESTKSGVHIYDNPVNVLTNNPEFPIQLFSLNNYRNLSPIEKEPTFGANIDYDVYCKGLGGLGLPGDLSSMSRFAKVAFTLSNSVTNDNEKESVSQFFHILESVYQQRGAVSYLHGDKKEYEITIYSSCMNTDEGIYYYKTYNNSRITKVDMHKENLDGNHIIHYSIRNEEDWLEEN